MQSSPLCSSTHSALNLNSIESWEQRKDDRLRWRRMCGVEQGKAGRGGNPHGHPRHTGRGDGRVPCHREQGWMPRANNGGLPHDHRLQQYQLPLQPTATTYSSQVWDSSSLKISSKRIVLLSLRYETTKQFWHPYKLFTLCQGLTSNSLLPTTPHTHPELLTTLCQHSTYFNFRIVTLKRSSTEQ